MHHKKGQFFGLWLVVLVLLMCIISIGVYYSSQKNLQVSLVSPLTVLEVQDQLELYEIREQTLIQETLKTIEETYEEETFTETLREGIIQGILQDEEMKHFIFKNLYLEGKNMEGQAKATEESFIRNRLYPEQNIERIGETIYISRETIGKHYYLQAESIQENSFPMDFYYEFKQTYKITNEGNEYKIEKTTL